MTVMESLNSNLIDGAINFIGGSLGGVALVYLGQPLDTIKVKLQTFPSLYRNSFHCFAQTFSKEGIYRGLYAGTIPAVVANVAENSVLFAAYGGCQKLMRFLTNTEKEKPLSAVSNAISGSLAGFFASFTLCPTEHVKCKLQALREVQMSKGLEVIKISPYEMTKKIIAEEGFKGLFRGLNSTIAREMTGYFAFFGAYEIVKDLLTPEFYKSKRPDLKDTLVTVNLIAGGAGGSAYWLTVFPADVVKSRLQISSVEGGLIELILKIKREEGFKALYKGLGPTLCRTIPSTAVLLAVVGLSTDFMRKIVDSRLKAQQRDSGQL